MGPKLSLRLAQGLCAVFVGASSVSAQPELRHLIAAPEQNQVVGTTQPFLAADLNAAAERLVVLAHNGPRSWHLITFDLKTGNEVGRAAIGPFPSGSGEPARCVFNAEHSIAAAYSPLGCIVVDGLTMKSQYFSRARCSQAAISPNGRLIAIAEMKGAGRDKASRISIFDRKTKRVKDSRKWFEGAIEILEFSSDSTLVAGYSRGWNNGSVLVWDSPAAKIKRAPETVSFGASQLTFSPDGESIFLIETPPTGGGTGIGLRQPPKPYAVRHLSLTTGRTSVVAGGHTLGLFSSQRHAGSGADWSPFVKIHPGSGEVITVDHRAPFFSEENEVQVVVTDPKNPGHHREWKIFNTREDDLTDATPFLFNSPDGSILATAAFRRAPGPGATRIRLWEFSTGRRIATLDEHDEACVGQILFSPDAGTMITLSPRLIRIWDLK